MAETHAILIPLREEFRVAIESSGSWGESTIGLIERIRNGDARARDILFARYLPIMRRWAHGRLPPDARGMLDTNDIVSESVMRALKHLGTFVPQHEGAFRYYLRTIVMRQILQAIRRSRRRPYTVELGESMPDFSRSPLAAVLGAEILSRYEKALRKLSREDRIAVVEHIEFDTSYKDIAAQVGFVTDNAARMRVQRALVKLAEAMRDLEP